MKRVVFFVSLMYFISCNSESESAFGATPLGSNAIVGQWKLEATKISPGGPVEWSDAIYKDVYKFDLSGTFRFISDQDAQYNKTGSYAVDGNELTLTYDTSTDGIKKSVFYFSIDDSKLLLDYIGCIEECRLRFVRLK